MDKTLLDRVQSRLTGKTGTVLSRLETPNLTVTSWADVVWDVPARHSAPR